MSENEDFGQPARPTPTPWMAVQMRHRWVGPDPSFEDGLWWIACQDDPERAPVAVVDHADDLHAPTRARAGVIAQQIVCAVNAHDDLVGALAAFVAAEKAWASEKRGGPGSFDDPLSDAYKLAVAAIAKARA